MDHNAKMSHMVPVKDKYQRQEVKKTGYFRINFQLAP